MVEASDKPAVPGKQAARKPEVPTRGKTVIADEVVSVVARIAAEQVEGVHQIGESSLRGVFSRLGRTGGVESEVGLKEAAVDIDLVVEFGFPIGKVAETLRRQIIESVEYMTGRTVVEVNINVVDVHVPKVEQSAKRRLE
jgi:uncharacterized alkaline shock family protein YloU